VFYGINGDYLELLQNRVKSATFIQVNRLLKKYINPKSATMVVVTPEPEKFRTQILSPRCNIQYAEGIIKPAEVLAEDDKIASFHIPLNPGAIKLLNAEELFD